MSRKRDIPFGYKMEMSRIVPDKSEADIVKQIFSLYLAGDSLKRISERMEASGARYHAGTDVWNKNMVKRILGNTRYMGNDEYPRIITPEDYIAVRLMTTEKLARRTSCAESIQPVSKIITCSKCGMKMQRHTHRGIARWICANDSCHETFIVADHTLRAEIDRCLDRLALSPALLAPCAPDEQQVSPDVLRMRNELTAAFNRGTESPEYMRSLIFALAAEQYNALPDMSLIHTLKELQDRIVFEGITEDNRREIEQKVVRRILLGRESGVSIELINGKIISSKEEAEQ